MFLAARLQPSAIGHALPSARAELFETAKKNKGGTLLLRDTQEGVVTDPNQLATETGQMI